MFQDYKHIAEFRMVYINEAHAADGKRPVGYAQQKGITEHDDYSERCVTAQMLMDDRSLTVPCLIDGMDNKVNSLYSAHPDRIFLVRKDGRLAVAADRGPFGFNPALNECKDWLQEFAKTGEEPKLKRSSKTGRRSRRTRRE